jgi:hypothetical protein
VSGFQVLLAIVAVNACVLGVVFLASCWLNKAVRQSGR